MPKIEFIKDWTVKQGDGKGPAYKAGDVVDVEQSYADKYKRRGLAVDYVEKAKPIEAPAEIRANVATEIRAGRGRWKPQLPPQDDPKNPV